jgi:RNA polymerase sigma factor (sigma-70 family)
MGESGTAPFKFACSSEFVREFVRGERAALERVYLAYFSDVESAVRRGMSASRPTFEDVRDVVQDVFIHAFAARARRSFDSTRDFGPFLATLTRHLLIDRMRRRARELRVTALESLVAFPEEPVEDAALDAQMLATVRRYVSSLPDLLRAIHEHRYVLGQPQQVACAALGLTRQRLRTLEKQLRAGLARELKVRAPHTPPVASAESEDSPTRTARRSVKA